MPSELSEAEVRVLGGAAADETLRALSTMKPNDMKAAKRLVESHRIEQLRQAIKQLDQSDSERSDIIERREYLNAILDAVNDLRQSTGTEVEVEHDTNIRYYDYDNCASLVRTPSMNGVPITVLAIEAAILLVGVVLGSFTDHAAVSVIALMTLIAAVLALGGLHDQAARRTEEIAIIHTDVWRMEKAIGAECGHGSRLLKRLPYATGARRQAAIQWMHDAAPVVKALRQVDDNDAAQYAEVCRDLYQRLETFADEGPIAVAQKKVSQIEQRYVAQIAARDVLDQHPLG